MVLSAHTLPRLLPRLLIGVLLIGVLAGCSGNQGRFVACPDVRISQGTGAATLPSANPDDEITVQIYGVSRQCLPAENGVRMQIAFDLLIERGDDNVDHAEEVVVEASFAVVDGETQLVSRAVYSESAIFGINVNRLQQVGTIVLTVPQGMRVVFGLGRARG